MRPSLALAGALTSMLLALPALAAKPTTPPAATPTPTPTPAPAANPVFPAAPDAKYAKLSASQARMKTCLDQYHANKATGGNAGLKWIQKGGGYFSACNKHLKHG